MVSRWPSSRRPCVDVSSATAPSALSVAISGHVGTQTSARASGLRLSPFSSSQWCCSAPIQSAKKALMRAPAWVFYGSSIGASSHSIRLLTSWPGDRQQGNRGTVLVLALAQREEWPTSQQTHTISRGCTSVECIGAPLSLRHGSRLLTLWPGNRQRGNTGTVLVLASAQREEWPTSEQTCGKLTAATPAPSAAALAPCAAARQATS